MRRPVVAGIQRVPRRCLYRTDTTTFLIETTKRKTGIGEGVSAPTLLKSVHPLPTKHLTPSASQRNTYPPTPLITAIIQNTVTVLSFLSVTGKSIVLFYFISDGPS